MIICGCCGSCYIRMCPLSIHYDSIVNNRQDSVNQHYFFQSATVHNGPGVWHAVGEPLAVGIEQVHLAHVVGAGVDVLVGYLWHTCDEDISHGVLLNCCGHFWGLYYC